MMLAALILIIQCLHAHMLEEQLHTNKSGSTESNSSSNAVPFSLEQSLGYSKSHVLLQGPKLKKILNISTNKSNMFNSEEMYSTQLDQKKEDSKLKSVVALQYNYDVPLRYNNANLLSKIPLKHLMISSQLKTENTTTEISRLHSNNCSATVKQTEKIVNKISLTESDRLKYPPYNWPTSSYASASSWAGGYGRPSAGGATANAQASASAGGSSASTSSGNFAGTGSGYQGGGTGSIPQPTSGFGGGTTGDSTSPSNSGGIFYNNYRPTGSIGGGGSSSGYNRPNVGSISGTGSSNSGSSFPVGAGFNTGGTAPRPVGYYGGYPPSIGETSGSSTTGAGAVSYEGKPTGSTSASSAGASGYHGSFNRPPSVTQSGSTSSAGSGGSSYSSYNKPSTSSTGNYNAYRPTTSSPSGNYNYYKPSSNSVTISPSSSGYGTYNKPTYLPTSGNHLNINNKPISGTTSRPSGAYYNGYFITTSPNYGSNTESIYGNRPSNGALKPPTGSDISNNFAGSTSGSSSGIGVIQGPVTNSGISPTSTRPESTPNLTATLLVPWWLETGVFSSAAITGSLQGVVSESGTSSSSIQGVNNFGSVTPTGYGTGGAASISTSGAGNQGGGSSFGAGSASNQLVVPGISSNFIPGNNNIGAGSSMVFGTGGVTSVSSSAAGIQGGGPSPGIISGAGSSSSSSVGSEIHGVGIPTGSFVGSTPGFQTNEGGGSLMGVINNNLGSVSTTENANQLNSSALSSVGLVTSSGSSQGSENSSSGDTLGLIQPVINPGLTPVATTSANLINSGISIILPWWLITGVFSGSVDHPGVVGTGELTGLTSAGSYNGSIVTPGWTGIMYGPGNNSESSGENIGIQHLQSSQSNAEALVGVGPNINIEPALSTETHSENQSLGNFQSGLPQGAIQTGGMVNGSQPEISPENNLHSSEGLVVSPTVPGNLPTTVEASQVESFISNLKPGISPFSNLASGSGDCPIREPVNNSHQGQVENLPNSSGSTTSNTFQNNVLISSQLGLSQVTDNGQQGIPSVDKVPGSPQSGIYPEIYFPSNSQSGFPSVSDIAISSRPQGWSGGHNGPASLIGFQSRPNSGSYSTAGTISSSGSGTNTIQFPYRVSVEKTSDIGTISVFKHPWLLVEEGKPPVLESSKQYHTELSNKPASNTRKDQTGGQFDESKDIIPVTARIN